MTQEKKEITQVEQDLVELIVHTLANSDSVTVGHEVDLTQANGRAIAIVTVKTDIPFDEAIPVPNTSEPAQLVGQLDLTKVYKLTGTIKNGKFDWNEGKGSRDENGVPILTCTNDDDGYISFRTNEKSTIQFGEIMLNKEANVMLSSEMEDVLCDSLKNIDQRFLGYEFGGDGLGQVLEDINEKAKGMTGSKGRETASLL